MATTIILTKLDDSADAILSTFASETGLEPEREDERWVFSVAGEEHGVNIVQTLTEIDPRWTDHVGLEDPV